MVLGLSSVVTVTVVFVMIPLGTLVESPLGTPASRFACQARSSWLPVPPVWWSVELEFAARKLFSCTRM